MEYSLMLSHQETKRFDLVGWMDSNWAQNPDNYHLGERFIFEVAGSVVTQLLKKQSMVAMEAEYITLANVVKKVVWLRILLKKIDFPQITEIIIFADN